MTAPEADEGMEEFFKTAYAYAVFPNVGKGAIGIGGAHGNGTVFVAEKPVGKTELKQVTVGLQLGGQSYREVVFFKDEDAFTSFKEGELKLSGQASAVAVTAGASADLGYSDGDFPHAEAAARESLAIPVYPELTAAQQERVVDVIEELLAA